MKLKSIPHNTFKRTATRLDEVMIPSAPPRLRDQDLDGHLVHVMERRDEAGAGAAHMARMPKTARRPSSPTSTFTVDFLSVEGALADGLESLLPPFSKTDIRFSSEHNGKARSRPLRREYGVCVAIEVCTKFSG